MSELMNDPSIPAAIKRTMLNNSQNAAGRKYLESKYGIDPYK
jgi:hypothetical protein